MNFLKMLDQLKEAETNLSRIHFAWEKMSKQSQEIMRTTAMVAINRVSEKAALLTKEVMEKI